MIPEHVVQVNFLMPGLTREAAEGMVRFMLRTELAPEEGTDEIPAWEIAAGEVVA